MVTEARSSVAKKWQVGEGRVQALLTAGKALLRDKQWPAAASMFGTAIQLVLQHTDQLPVVLLSCVAACALELGNHDTEFFYSGAVLGLPHTPQGAKAYHQTTRATTDDLWRTWPLIQLQLTGSITDLSTAEQQFILKKIAVLKAKLSDGGLRSIVAEGLAGESAAGLQSMFGQKLMKCAVHVVRELYASRDHGIAPVQQARCPADSRSLQPALDLKEAADEAFQSKDYVTAMAKYREALSEFVLLPTLLVLSSLAHKRMMGTNSGKDNSNGRESTCSVYILKPLAALAVHPGSEAALATVATGAHSRSQAGCSV